MARRLPLLTLLLSAFIITSSGAPNYCESVNKNNTARIQSDVAAVSNLMVSATFNGVRSQSGFSLTWNYTPGDADQFIIERFSEKSNTFGFLEILPGHVMHFLDTTFLFSQHYKYRVAAIKNNVQGEFVVVSTPGGLTWNTIKPLSAVINNNGSVNFDWDYQLQKPDRIEVYINSKIWNTYPGDTRSLLIQELTIQDRIEFKATYDYYSAGVLNTAYSTKWVNLSDSFGRYSIGISGNQGEPVMAELKFSGNAGKCDYLLEGSSNGKNYSTIKTLNPYVPEVPILFEKTTYLRVKRLWGNNPDIIAEALAFVPEHGSFDRLVLNEFFQGEYCAPSKALEKVMNPLKLQYQNQMVTLSYFTYNFYSKILSKSNGPGFQRFGYYKNTAIPTIFVNGGHRIVGYYSNTVDVWKTAIKEEQEINTPFEINCTSTTDLLNQKQMIRVVVYGEQNVRGNLILHVASVENKITSKQMPGYTGDDIFEDVVRKMFPDGNGLALKNTWILADSSVYEYEWYYGNEIYDPMQLSAVAFIQESGSRYVYQVRSSRMNPFIFPASFSSPLIYPNPSTGVVKLLMPERTEGEVTMKVCDNSGIEVAAESVIALSDNPVITVDLSHLPAGVYHVQLCTGGSNYTSKLVIHH